MKEKDLSCFVLVFTACLVLGRLNNVCLFLCTLVNLYVYCTVLLNAKCALNGDMACLLSVNGPAWFPIIIHLSVITILSIYFYWIYSMFIFWCFACWLLILHKHFIFIHCSASFTVMWVPKGLGVAYTNDHVWKWEYILVLFNCVL